MDISGVKIAICGGIGVVGSVIAEVFGGWDAAMITLVTLMIIDYIMGILVAAVWHNSPKSESGTLESRAGWKGLCRKGVILLIVLIAARLDILLSTSNIVRNAAIIGYSANELISVVENAGLMGVPIPSVIQKAIDVLQKEAEGEDNNVTGD